MPRESRLVGSISRAPFVTAALLALLAGAAPVAWGNANDDEIGAPIGYGQSDRQPGPGELDILDKYDIAQTEWKDVDGDSGDLPQKKSTLRKNINLWRVYWRQQSPRALAQVDSTVQTALRDVRRSQIGYGDACQKAGGSLKSEPGGDLTGQPCMIGGARVAYLKDGLAYNEAGGVMDTPQNKAAAAAKTSLENKTARDHPDARSGCKYGDASESCQRLNAAMDGDCGKVCGLIPGAGPAKNSQHGAIYDDFKTSCLCDNGCYLVSQQTGDYQTADNQHSTACSQLSAGKSTPVTDAAPPTWATASPASAPSAASTRTASGDLTPDSGANESDEAAGAERAKLIGQAAADAQTYHRKAQVLSDFAQRLPDGGTQPNDVPLPDGTTLPKGTPKADIERAAAAAHAKAMTADEDVARLSPPSQSASPQGVTTGGGRSEGEMQPAGGSSRGGGGYSGGGTGSGGGVANTSGGSPHDAIAMPGGPCSGAVMTMIAQKAVEAGADQDVVNSHDPHRLAKWIKDNPGKVDVAGIESTYSCDSTQGMIGGWQMTSQLVGNASSAAAGVAGQAATMKLSNYVANNPNDMNSVHREALLEMAQAERTTAYMQLTTGGVQAVLAGIGGWQGASHKGRATDVEGAMGGNTDYAGCEKTVNKECVERSQDNLSMAGLGYALSKTGNSTSEHATDTGNKLAADAVAKERGYGDQYWQLMVQNSMQGAINLAGSLLKFNDANWLEDQAAKLGVNTANQLLNPIPVGNPPGHIGDQTPPPVLAPGGGGGDGSPVTGAPDNPAGGGGAPIPPPIMGGGANPGGLAGDVPPGTGGTVGPGTTAGGGGGGLGGGGGGAPDAQTPPGGPEAVAGDKTKFESTAGGGAYTAAGGGPKRDGSAGGMDMRGLLEGLLPKKEDLAKRDPASILDKKKGGRAGAEGDDGSILGRDSNLFTRISKVHYAYYQRGHLK